MWNWTELIWLVLWRKNVCNCLLSVTSWFARRNEPACKNRSWGSAYPFNPYIYWATDAGLYLSSASFSALYTHLTYINISIYSLHCCSRSEVFQTSTYIAGLRLAEGTWSTTVIFKPTNVDIKGHYSVFKSKSFILLTSATELRSELIWNQLSVAEAALEYWSADLRTDEMVCVCVWVTYCKLLDPRLTNERSRMKQLPTRRRPRRPRNSITHLSLIHKSIQSTAFLQHTYSWLCMSW